RASGDGRARAHPDRLRVSAVYREYRLGTDHVLLVIRRVPGSRGRVSGWFSVCRIWFAVRDSGLRPEPDGPDERFLLRAVRQVLFISAVSARRVFVGAKKPARTPRNPRPASPKKRR